MITSGAAFFGMILMSLPVLVSNVQAAPLNVSALESPIGRFLLGETNEGFQILSRILGHAPGSSSSVDEALALMNDGQLRDVQKTLEERIGRVREKFQEARQQRNGGKEVPETQEMGPEERLILREVAGRELKIQQIWEAELGRGEFATQSEAGGLTSSRQRFLSATSEDHALGVPEEVAENASVDLQEAGSNRLKKWAQDLTNWSDESRTCMSNRNKGEAFKAWVRNFGEQVLISTSVTTVGSLARFGFAKLDLRAFSLDIMMGFISTGVSMGLMNDHDSMLVRWIKVLGWGVGRSNVDAWVYEITPWTDTHGFPMAEAVRERKEFNIAWNVKTSWVSPTMFRVLNGIECVASARGVSNLAAIRKLNFAVKTSVSTVNSYLYYGARTSSVISSRTR